MPPPDLAALDVVAAFTTWLVAGTRFCAEAMLATSTPAQKMTAAQILVARNQFLFIYTSLSSCFFVPC